MKFIVAAAVAATALTSIATGASAQPYRHHHGRMVQVCEFHHHHRVCRMVHR